MVLFNVFLFASLKTITAVRSSVMLAFSPVVVSIASFVLFKERISTRVLVGIIGTTIGAILTITEGDFATLFSSGIAVGDLLMICSVLSWVAYSIIIKIAMMRLSALALLTYASFLGVIILLPFTFIENGWSSLFNLSASGFWSLLYLSIFSAGFAYLWYFEGIEVVGSTKASLFLNLEPVSAIFLGIVMLNENINIPIFIGSVLVIGSLYLSNSKN